MPEKNFFKSCFFKNLFFSELRGRTQETRLDCGIWWQHFQNLASVSSKVDTIYCSCRHYNNYILIKIAHLNCINLMKLPSKEVLKLLGKNQ